MLFRWFFTNAIILSFLSCTAGISSADDLQDLKKRIEILGRCISLPEDTPEGIACDAELKEAKSKSLLGCDEISNTEEKVSCYRRFSDAGNGDASMALGRAFAGQSNTFKGLPLNQDESTRFKLLAYKQGNIAARVWYRKSYIPPQPYKWEIGMSKNQVLHSIDGEPHKIVKTTTANDEMEVWFYTGATLYFGPRRKGELLELIQQLD